MTQYLPSKKFTIIIVIVVTLALGMFVHQYFSRRSTDKAAMSVIKDGSTAVQGVNPGSPAFINSLTQDTGGEENVSENIVGVSPLATGGTPTQPTRRTTVVDPNLYITSPYIGSLSSSVFANGDTITISGKNFTDNNTVLLSIDFPGKFTNVRATNGGTRLQFTVTLSVSSTLRQNLSGLTNIQHDAIVDKIIRVKSKTSSYKDGWYMPALIQVKNENGVSNTVPVSIDVMKGV